MQAMQAVYFVAPFTETAVDALKLAALYFDRIVIDEKALLHMTPQETITVPGTEDTHIKIGRLRAKLKMPDEGFLKAISVLLQAGVVTVAPAQSRDNRISGDEWGTISQNIFRLFDENPGLLFNLLHQKREKDDKVFLVVPPEVDDLHRRYIGSIGEGGELRQFNHQFIRAYYAMLLSDLYAHAFIGNIPLTCSPLLREFAHQVYAQKAARQDSRHGGSVAGAIPYIAQDVLRLFLPDVSSLACEDILEIRESLQEQLLRFREELGRITYDAVTEAQGARSQTKLDEIIRYRVKPCVEDFEKKARGSSARVLRLFLEALKRPASYVPFLGSLFQQIPAQVAFLLSLGIVVGETAEKYLSELKEVKQNGLYYLIDLSRALRRRAKSRPGLQPASIFDPDQGYFTPWIPSTLWTGTEEAMQKMVKDAKSAAPNSPKVPKKK